MNIKICNKCGKVGLDQFDFGITWQHNTKVYYYRNSCKICQNNDSKEYNKLHKEQRKQYDKEHYRLNTEYYRKQSKRYYNENKEQFSDWNKQWHIKNPEYQKQYDKEYYKEHSDIRKQNSNTWRQNNKQRLVEYNRQYGLNNISRKRDYQRERYKNNKVYFYAIIAARRANKLKQTPNLSIIELKRINELFRLCKELNTKNNSIGYHVDHIIPISKGGLHHPDNLRIISISDNCRKQNKLDYILQDAIDIRL